MIHADVSICLLLEENDLFLPIRVEVVDYLPGLLVSVITKECKKKRATSKLDFGHFSL